MVFGSRKQMIVDFKTRLFFKTSIDAAKIRKEIEPRIRAGLESGAHVNNMRRWYNNSDFSVRFNNFSYPIGVFTLQRRHQLGRRRFLIWICRWLRQVGLFVFPGGHEAIAPARTI